MLRNTVGCLMLFHGVAKAQGGVEGIAGMFVGKGLPGFLAYGVYGGEVVAPILVLAGFWTRPAAAVLAVNMVVATLLVHSGELFTLTQHGGWALELQAFYMFAAVAIALLGAGKFSASGSGKFD